MPVRHTGLWTDNPELLHIFHRNFPPEKFRSGFRTSVDYIRANLTELGRTWADVKMRPILSADTMRLLYKLFENSATWSDVGERVFPHQHRHQHFTEISVNFWPMVDELGQIHPNLGWVLPHLADGGRSEFGFVWPTPAHILPKSAQGKLSNIAVRDYLRTMSGVSSLSLPASTGCMFRQRQGGWLLIELGSLSTQHTCNR